MAKFQVGDLVHHVRYDYRGVVVKVDCECRASEDWYQGNRTQPDRAQPWYHMLVDGGRETYVAETSVEPDASGGTVDHPLVDDFFTMFLGGRYHRYCPN